MTTKQQLGGVLIDQAGAPRKWKGARTGGGFLTNKHPPVFTHDLTGILCCTGPTIKLFSTSTSHVLRTLQGHTGEVTGMIVNPVNGLQLYSSSMDGTIKLWDYGDGVLLKTWDLNQQVLHMAIDPTTPSVVYVAVLPEKSAHQAKQTSMDIDENDGGEHKEKEKGKEKKKTDRQNHPKRSKEAPWQSGRRRSDGPRELPFAVLRFDFTKGKKEELFRVGDYPRGLLVSPKGDFVAVPMIRRHFYLYDVFNADLQRINHSAIITCMAFHTVEPLIAYGDKSGKITHHYCMGNPSENLDDPSLKSEMHWHAESVHAITFSPDGNYMYTGGEEAVVVIWQRGTGAKQFLPRQGATIHSITLSPDAQRFIVNLADNSIRIYSALSLEIERKIVGLSVPVTSWRWGVPKVTIPLTGLVIEPRNKLLVLNGAPGCLQFYDVMSDRYVTHLVVSPSPQVMSVAGVKIPETAVEKIAFSQCGNFLLTVDTRLDPALRSKMGLKFWHYDTSKQRFSLNTEVEAPHRKRITGVAFNPKTPMAATCSQDSQFKIWVQASEGAAKPHTPWACEAVGYYRDEAAHGVAFSGDGTILAVAYSKVVTLWDPTTITLLKVLGHPTSTDPKDFLRAVYFVPNSHLLVSHTPYAIYVWNLLTCSLWWSYNVRVRGFAMEPARPGHPSSRFAVGTPHYIFLFDAKSPTPLCYWKVQKTRVHGLAFRPATAKSGASLIYLNERSELVTLEEDEQGGDIVDSMKGLSIRKTTATRAITLKDTDQTLAQRATQPKQPAAPLQAKGKEKSTGKEPLSKFERIFGTQGLETPLKKGGDAMDVDEPETRVTNPSKQLHTSIFDGPSHVIAAPSNIYMSFMEGLVKKASMDIPAEEPQAEVKSAGADTSKGAPEQQLAAEGDIDDDVLLRREFDKDLTHVNTKRYGSILDFFTEGLGGRKTTEPSGNSNNSAASKPVAQKKEKGKRKGDKEDHQEKTAEKGDTKEEGEQVKTKKAASKRKGEGEPKKKKKEEETRKRKKHEKKDSVGAEARDENHVNEHTKKKKGQGTKKARSKTMGNGV